ncbi:MAG: DUF4198 domain-containing protein [Ahrensia sp.]|nr:DUF4198 domain-containing protein [Ahrensia sp.]
MLKIAFRTLIAISVFTPLSVNAHELWLDAKQYRIEPNTKIVADIKVGQNFSGSTFSFIPNSHIRFDVALGDTVIPVTGRLGDAPAVNIDPIGEGLNVLIHQSTTLDVYYAEWEKFGNFIKHKDFKGAEERHDARGLPREKFREAYSRYAKSLIGVGNSQGQDRAYGLETEIIALENPYTDNIADGLDVKVVYRDMPRADVQVEIFEKSTEPNTAAEVKVFTTRTNQQGIATIDVKPGFTYQIDAVVLREDLSPKAQNIGAVWETLWANSTFAIPN